jgi:cell division protease FtsH
VCDELIIFAERNKSSLCYDGRVVYGRGNRSSLHRKQKPAPASSNRLGEPHAADKATMPPRNAWVSFLIILLVNYFLVKTFFADPDAPLTLPYTVFKQEVTKDNAS